MVSCFLSDGWAEGSSWAWCAPESVFNLLQGFAFCLRDEDHGEDDIEEAHTGKEPEGSSAC